MKETVTDGADTKKKYRFSSVVISFVLGFLVCLVIVVVLNVLVYLKHKRGFENRVRSLFDPPKQMTYETNTDATSEHDEKDVKENTNP